MSARHLTIPLALALSASVLAGCGQSTPPAEQPPSEQQAPEAPSADQKGPTSEDVTELKIEDLTAGTGTEAVAGKTVTVHYTGWLTDGTKFDSSVDRGEPFAFQLGAGRVIPGWEQGVTGMKVGGKRRLIIPPDMGYGPQGTGPIPPNATLIFDVELLGVQ